MVLIPQSPNDVSETWLKIVLSEALKWPEVKVNHLTPITKKDGFLSGVFTAQVSNEKTGESTSLFIKVILPADDPFRQFMNDYSIDEVEVEGYRHFMPLLATFEQDTLGTTEIADIAPKFYAGDYNLREESRGFFLIIEDLAPKFTMRDTSEGLSNEHITMVLRKMAQLHAVSFAYGQIKMINFAETKLRSKYEKFCSDPNIYKMSDDSFPFLLEDIKVFKPHLLEPVKIFWEKQKEAFKDIFNLEETRFLIHGDLWSNNVMFSNEDCRIVDWQFLSASHPMTDLSMLIFSSTEPEIRQKHMEEWIHSYYVKFSETCASFGLEPPITIDGMKEFIHSTGLLITFETLIFGYETTRANIALRDRLLWLIEKVCENCPKYFTK